MGSEMGQKTDPDNTQDGKHTVILDKSYFVFI